MSTLRNFVVLVEKLTEEKVDCHPLNHVVNVVMLYSKAKKYQTFVHFSFSFKRKLYEFR